MKKLILLFTLISGFSFGQMENFIIENYQARWNKVYDTTKDISVLKKSLLDKNNIKIIEETENSISGEFSDLLMNYKKAGFSYMLTPLILNETNKYSGVFKIELREGRYRATIRNVKSEGMSLTIGGGGFSGTGLGLGSDLDTTLEAMAIDKKGNMKKAFPKVAGKIIDTTFTDLMDLNTQNTDNPDW